MKKIIVVIIIVIIGLGVYFFTVKNEKTFVPSAEESVTNKAEINSIFILQKQDATNTVLIDMVDMARPGFIAIRESINNQPGQIVEVSVYLTSGVNTSISIDLGRSMLNGVDFSGEFPLSTDLVAIVYEDDGDQGFNPSFDKPVYVGKQVLARYIGTGEVAPNSAVIPNTGTKNSLPSSATITYTDEGFSPTTVQVSKGETVLFINKSSKPMWVASVVHPAHTVLPTFDQFETAGFDESYSCTFEQRGTWEYHDHVNASKTGTIIVR